MIRLIEKYTNSRANEFTNSILRSRLCDFSDAYIIVREISSGTAGGEAIFENCSLFIKYTIKYNRSGVDWTWFNYINV